MSLAGAIVARLGLNTAEFRSELANAAGVAEGAHNQMGGAARRNTEAHNNLLASNHRVARQIQTFSKDLVSGADATQLLSAGLEGLERSLKLPLGALAALGVGAVAIQQVGSVISEYEKLGKEIDKVLAPRRGDRATPLSEVKSEAEAASAAIEKLDTANTGFWRGLLNGVVLNPYKVIKGAFTGNAGDSVKGGEQITDDQRAELERVRNGANEADAKHQRRINAVNGSDLDDGIKEALRAALDWREKILEAAARGGELLAGPLKQAAAIDLAKAAEKLADHNRDSVKETLKELAARPEVATNDQSFSFYQEGKAARDAIKEQELGEKERLAGHQDLAQSHFSRAEQIKDGIGGLRDAEKDRTVILGGDTNAILQEIKDELRRIESD